MRIVLLLIFLSGCAAPCPKSGNATLMAMGEPISNEELAKLNLPKPEPLSCR